MLSEAVGMGAGSYHHKNPIALNNSIVVILSILECDLQEIWKSQTGSGFVGSQTAAGVKVPVASPSESPQHPTTYRPPPRVTASFIVQSIRFEKLHVLDSPEASETRRHIELGISYCTLIAMAVYSKHEANQADWRYRRDE